MNLKLVNGSGDKGRRVVQVLPCPFCLSRPVVRGSPRGAWVECMACQARGPFSRLGTTKAVQFWNMRPPGGAGGSPAA